MEYEMINNRDIRTQEIMLKRSKEILRLKKKLKDAQEVYRKLEKERWVNYSNDISKCPF